MKRRDVLRAAAAASLLATARGRAEQPSAPAAAKWPGEEKLSKSKREIAEAMAKVRLANAEGPDLLPPRARRRK